MGWDDSLEGCLSTWQYINRLPGHAVCDLAIHFSSRSLVTVATKRLRVSGCAKSRDRVPSEASIRVMMRAGSIARLYRFMSGAGPFDIYFECRISPSRKRTPREGLASHTTMFANTANPPLTHADSRRQSTTSSFFLPSHNSLALSTDDLCPTSANGVNHAPVSPSCSGQGYSILPLEPSPGGHPFTPSSSAGIQSSSRGEMGLIGCYKNSLGG